MFLRSSLVALMALLISIPVLAQGPCPDGLSGACCSSAVPNLPPLPPVTWLDARQICAIDCNATPDQYFQMTMSPPTPVAGGCGTDFDVTLTSLGPELCTTPGANTIRLNYTRHWQQAFPGLGNLRVYRFVATGSLCITPGFCNVEGPPQHPFVFGFVDYAFQVVPPGCGFSFVAAAVALGHSCDAYMHDATCPFTQDPVSTHPVDEYVLVAPGSNFTPNLSMVPPQGPSPVLPRVGLRWIGPNSAGTCSVNEQITQLQLTNVLAECPCLPGTPPPPQSPYWRQSLRLSTACGTGVSTTPICPFTPPTLTTAPFDTLMAWSIGSWGIGQFPGLPGPGNQFFLAQGSASVQSNAAAPCPVQPLRTVYYGVENRWAGNGRRVDLVDNVQQIPGTVLFQPVVGGMPPTTGPSGTHVLFFY